MVVGGKDALSERIADAEERLRQLIAQRIERNRQELVRLQQEQERIDVASGSSPREASCDTSSGTATMLLDRAGGGTMGGSWSSTGASFGQLPNKAPQPA